MSDTPININLAFEDEPSELAMIKMLGLFNKKYNICNSYSGNGSGYIKKNINGFNEGAKFTCFFVLTDLDNYNCPIDIKREWLKRSEYNNLIFRVAIREIEAWLLADRDAFSRFTGVNIKHIALNPEDYGDPKKALIEIVKKSRNRSLKEDIIPARDKAKVGPDYNNRLIEYIRDYWEPNRAKDHCESLRRALIKLETFEFFKYV